MRPLSLLAQSGHSPATNRCPLLGAKRTLQLDSARRRLRRESVEAGRQCYRIIVASIAGRLLEQDEQRGHDERRDHQQLEIVDVCNDLRLLRDDGIECRASGIGGRIPELCDGRIFENAVHCKAIVIFQRGPPKQIEVFCDPHGAAGV